MAKTCQWNHSSNRNCDPNSVNMPPFQQLCPNWLQNPADGWDDEALSGSSALDESDMIINKGGPYLDPPSDDENWQDDEPAELLDPKNVFWRYPDELEESIQVSVPPFPLTPHFF